MKIDNETGELLSVSAETYENMKEEKDKRIENLEQEITDLEDENYDLKEQLEEEKENAEFFMKLYKIQRQEKDLLFDKLFGTKKRFNHGND